MPSDRCKQNDLCRMIAGIAQFCPNKLDDWNSKHVPFQSVVRNWSPNLSHQFLRITGGIISHQLKQRHYFWWETPQHYGFASFLSHFDPPNIGNSKISHRFDSSLIYKFHLMTPEFWFHCISLCVKFQFSTAWRSICWEFVAEPRSDLATETRSK